MNNTNQPLLIVTVPPWRGPLQIVPAIVIGFIITGLGAHGLSVYYPNILSMDNSNAIIAAGLFFIFFGAPVLSISMFVTAGTYTYNFFSDRLEIYSSKVQHVKPSGRPNQPIMNTLKDAAYDVGSERGDIDIQLEQLGKQTLTIPYTDIRNFTFKSVHVQLRRKNNQTLLPYIKKSDREKIRELLTSKGIAFKE